MAHNKKCRMTLAKYLGKYVWVVGVYGGFPIKHEKTGIEFNYTSNEWERTSRDNNIEIENKEQPSEAESPIFFPIYASFIKDVVGIKGFEDINEDHINIQTDIAQLKPEINIGDVVEIYGFVGKYKRKDGSIDYNIKLKAVYPVRKNRCQ